MTVASSLTMVRSLREKAGAITLLIPGHLIDPILAPFCNGVTIRNFNWGWYHKDGKKKSGLEKLNGAISSTEYGSWKTCFLTPRLSC